MSILSIDDIEIGKLYEFVEVYDHGASLTDEHGSWEDHIKGGTLFVILGVKSLAHSGTNENTSLLKIKLLTRDGRVVYGSFWPEEITRYFPSE